MDLFRPWVFLRAFGGCAWPSFSWSRPVCLGLARECSLRLLCFLAKFNFSTMVLAFRPISPSALERPYLSGAGLRLAHSSCLLAGVLLFRQQSPFLLVRSPRPCFLPNRKF